MRFLDVLTECASHDALVKEFNRLSKTNLCFHDKRKPIEKMVDDATGYTNIFNNNHEEMQKFISFVFEYIWLPLISEEQNALENQKG